MAETAEKGLTLGGISLKYFGKITLYHPELSPFFTLPPKL